MMISIHALLAESDRASQSYSLAITHFYPRSPCGERLQNALEIYWMGLFLSTLSLRRATRIPQDQLSNDGYFYPLSPCGERRRDRIPGPPKDTISIHALLAESDTIFAVRPYDAPIFLSTLSLRRATKVIPLTSLVVIDFYPRSPCGERPPWDQLRHK